MRLIDVDAIPWPVDGVGDIPVITKQEIEEMPVIDAVPVRHGKWSRHTLGSTSGYGTTVMHQCSECESMTISRFRYCPNCGAKMDVERKEE